MRRSVTLRRPRLATTAEFHTETDVTGWGNPDDGDSDADIFITSDARKEVLSRAVTCEQSTSVGTVNGGG